MRIRKHLDDSFPKPPLTLCVPPLLGRLSLPKLVTRGVLSCVLYGTIHTIYTTPVKNKAHVDRGVHGVGTIVQLSVHNNDPLQERPASSDSLVNSLLQPSEVFLSPWAIIHFSFCFRFCLFFRHNSLSRPLHVRHAGT